MTIIHDLCEVLAWCEQQDDRQRDRQDTLQSLCSSLRCQHENFVFDGLSQALVTLESTGGDELRRRVHKIYSGLEELPDSRVKKILHAPETCFQLYEHKTQFHQGQTGEPADLLGLLERAVTAEAFAEGMIERPEFALWSVLGDRYFYGVSSPWSNLISGFLEDPDKDYSAPVAKGDLVIDYLSPSAARPMLANNFREKYALPACLAKEQRLAVTDKITDGMKGLVKGCPDAAVFVKSMLRTIMPRSEPGINGFEGSSNRSLIGRANLLNPMYPEINAANMASSLVHESVHTALYISEVDNLPVSDTDKMYHELILSPWSNRPIHLLAYIHASFVWFSLYHLWSLGPLRQQLGDAVADYYLDKAGQGFADGKMFATIVPYLDFIRQDIVEALEVLQQRMLDI